MSKTATKTTSRTALFKFSQSLQVWIIAVLGTIGVGFILMVLAGVFSPKVPVDKDAASHQRGLPTTGQVDGQLVQVELLRRPRFESAVGSISPVLQSSIAARILAKVVEVNVIAGQAVTAGEVVVRLGDEDLRSRLEQAEAANQAAEARLSQARADFERAGRLVEGNAISRAEYEALATAVRTTQAELDRSSRAMDETKVFLDYATVTAPYDGIVIDKKVQSGDTVTPGQTLLTIYDPNEMQLVANVRESLAMKLKVGQEVAAKLESLDYECLATVREVVPEAEVGSRSFKVKVSGPCPPGIYSGMFGRILLPLEDEQIVVIPAAAIRRVGQLTLVDTRDGDSLVRRNIQTGRRLGEDVEVLSGLRPGEEVFVPAKTSGHEAPQAVGLNSTGDYTEGSR